MDFPWTWWKKTLDHPSSPELLALKNSAAALHLPPPPPTVLDGKMLRRDATGNVPVYVSNRFRMN